MDSGMGTTSPITAIDLFTSASVWIKVLFLVIFIDSTRVFLLLLLLLLRLLDLLIFLCSFLMVPCGFPLRNVIVRPGEVMIDTSARLIPLMSFLGMQAAGPARLCRHEYQLSFLCETWANPWSREYQASLELNCRSCGIPAHNALGMLWGSA